MNYEEDRPRYSPLAYALTCQEAITEARRQLCALSSYWCTASDAQVVQHIRTDCTIFTEQNSPIRLAIFGTTQCPTTAKSCLEGGGGGGGDNTMLLLGLGAVALLGVVLVATQRPAKKIIVAKVR